MLTIITVPALFAFPARHRALPFDNSFKCAYQQPTGHHPKLQIDIKPTKAPRDECSLHAHFVVPQPFFVDPYQLADDSIMKSMGIRHVRSIIGETDLEAPVWTKSKWGAAVVVDIETRGKESRSLKVEMPLHLRYMVPLEDEERTKASMPWPVLFWACTEDECECISKPSIVYLLTSFVGEEESKRPFDRKALGYEDQFSPNTVYHHLRAESDGGPGSLKSMAEIPILDLKHSGMIELGTTAVITIGFLALLLQIIIGALRSCNKSKVDDTKKKQ